MKDIDDNQLRKHYMQTFNTESGQIVLRDLENRCHKRDTTFMPMVNMFGEEIYINEGKRQTLLHIENMMSLENIEPTKGSE